MSNSSSSHERERKLFDTVASLVQTSTIPPASISDTIRLRFYGLYKRVVVGRLNDTTSLTTPVRPPRPSRFNLVAWYKYDAWAQCDSLSDLQAIMEYVQLAASQDNDTGRLCKTLLQEYEQEMLLSAERQNSEGSTNESMEVTGATTTTSTSSLVTSPTHTPTMIVSSNNTGTLWKRTPSLWKPFLPRGQLDIQYLDLLYALFRCVFFISWEILSKYLFFLRSPCSIPHWIRQHSIVAQAWKESSSQKHSTNKQTREEDPENEIVVGLSVRSLLDLYLSVRQYPPGSEIIITPPLNIEGMIRVMQYHHIHVIPVDIQLDRLENPESYKKNEATNRWLPFKVNLSEIQKRISTKTVAIMIVHPFGAISLNEQEMKELQDIIHTYRESSSREIDILEDCAQCYSANVYRGSPFAHVQFFSFGTIKTSTALGGGIAVLPQNQTLVAKMKEWQCRMYGQQLHVEYMIKVIRMTVLHFVSLHPNLCGMILQAVEKLGWNYDLWVTEMIRGFQVSRQSDHAQVHPYHNLMKQLRRRPCSAMLSLMNRRLTQCKRTQACVERRVRRCHDMNQVLLRSNACVQIPVHATEDPKRQLYWLHPILVPDPITTEREMRSRGFDVPMGTSQMKCVTEFLVSREAEQSHCPNAEWMMQHILYLPTASRSISEKGNVELCTALEESTHSVQLNNDVEQTHDEDARHHSVCLLFLSITVAFLALFVHPRILFKLITFSMALVLYSFWFIVCAFVFLRFLVGKYYIDRSNVYSKYCCMAFESKEDISNSTVDGFEDKWTMRSFNTHQQSKTILDIAPLRVESHPISVEEGDSLTQRHVLLTGATGFIGSLLLRDLLLRRKALNINGGVVVICRSRRNSTSTERIMKLLGDSMFSFLSEEEKNNLVLVLEGDVTRPNLGLSETDYFRLTRSLYISHIIHCAASVSFTQSLLEAASSNITSALQMQSLRKAMRNKNTAFTYVSTAFVHGSETGSLNEPLKETLYRLDPFDPILIYESMMTNQIYAQEAMTKLGFPNTYSLSKCVCEHLLSREDAGGPTVIIRPSIVGPSVQEPYEGWSGFYPSTLIASGCLYYRFQYLLWSFSDEIVPVIPVDIVVKFIIAKAFVVGEGSSPKRSQASIDNPDDEVNGFEILSCPETKSSNGFHLLNSVSTITSCIIYNVAWDSSSRKEFQFSWYDFALAILHNGCAKGMFIRPVAYVGIAMVFKALPFLNLSHGVYMKLHHAIVAISISFMNAYSWICGNDANDLKKINQLRPFFDLPLLFVPYTQRTFYFESELITNDDFNGERYMFSCVLAAEKFVRSFQKRSCCPSNFAAYEVTLPTKKQIFTDLVWALTQPRGNVVIRIAAFLMRQLFFLTGMYLTVDMESISQISQAVEELKCRSGDTLNVVLVPTHRSLFDFLLISYVLFSVPELQLDLPYIAAAEEFSTLPILGWLAENCGAFFIKRGLGQVDKQLSIRISQLQQRKNEKNPICYEIFIEGKRSRDRVFIKPKTGLLKCLQAIDKNLIIVPMTINYESVPDQRSLLDEAKGLTSFKFLLSDLFKWFQRVIDGKVRLGRIHIAASRPLIVQGNSTDWNLVADVIQRRQMQNSFVSEFHIKCGATALTLHPHVVRQGLIAAGCKLWPQTKHRGSDESLPSDMDLNEAWYGFLQGSHLFGHLISTENKHWLQWLRGLSCQNVSDDPCLKAISDRINEIFSDIDEAICTTEMHLEQKGYKYFSFEHILQYAQELQPKLPLLLLRKSLSIKQLSKNQSTASHLAHKPMYDEHSRKEIYHKNGQEKLPLGDEENFGAWGFRDTAFIIRPDANGRPSVALTGERYRVSGRMFPALISFMEEEMGIKINPYIPSIPAAPARPNVAQSTLSTDQLQMIKRVLNNEPDRVSTDPLIRARHGMGQSQEDMFLIRQDRLYTTRLPDAVLYPKTEDEIYQLLQLAATEKLAVIPFGGGTNVTHAIRCPSTDFESRPILSVDLKLMNSILSLHDEDGVAHVQAGMTGKALALELATRGFTMGHEPDSYEFSTLGGWIATNSSGMKQNKYGNIEQIVKDVRVVSSRGVIWQSAGPYAVCSGRSSIGTNLVSLMIGSEGSYAIILHGIHVAFTEGNDDICLILDTTGSLGIITSAKIKVWPLPPKKLFDSFLFHSYENGVRFVHDISKMGGLKPASVRLLDNKQLRLGQTMIVSNSSTQSIVNTAKTMFRQLFLSSYMTKSTACCTLCYEGSANDIEIQRMIVHRLSSKHDGFPSGGAVGESGYHLTFTIAYLRDFAMTYGFLAESFETFAPWSKVDEIILRTTDRIRHEHKNRALPGVPFISTRITQLYDEGACIYFYLCLYVDGVNEPHHVFADIENCARREILLHGGTLSHHHGVGKLRSPFMKCINSEPFESVLKSVKVAFDPENIFIGNGSFYPMPQYGQLSYWTKRYAQDDIPFDWMCGYDELSDTLTPLLWPAVEDPSKSILIAGCGNARFSSDLFYDGYLNIVNIDYCDVVIQQQRSKFPEMDWRVMNALCMDEFEDEKFDFIIDKSLSDTTLCYASGIETTRLLFTEFHRVLKPGGRIIIVSLHSEEDVIELSQISETMVFAVSTGRLPSNREIANRSSSPFHTIAVFDKLTGLTDEEKYSILVQHPISFVNASIRMDEKDRSDDWEGNMELHESGKAIVDDCTSLEELIALYNTVFEEYSQSIESWDDEVNCGKVK